MSRPEQIKFSLGQLFDMDDEGHTYHIIETYIGQLEQECEYLKAHNEELQHYNVGLANAEFKLKQERDQLKAYVSALREVAEDALETAHGGTDRAEIQYVLDQSPEVSMTEHDAEVIEKVASELKEAFPHHTGVYYWLIGLAYELRQKAQEQNK